MDFSESNRVLLYLRVYVSVCMNISVCGPENTSESSSSCFLRQSLSLALALLIQSGWLTSEAPEIHLSLSPGLASAHSHAWIFGMASGTELGFSGLLFPYYLPSPKVPEMISLSLGLKRSVGIFLVLVLLNW